MTRLPFEPDGCLLCGRTLSPMRHFDACPTCARGLNEEDKRMASMPLGERLSLELVLIAAGLPLHARLARQGRL